MTRIRCAPRLEENDPALSEGFEPSGPAGPSLGTAHFTGAPAEGTTTGATGSSIDDVRNEGADYHLNRAVAESAQLKKAVMRSVSSEKAQRCVTWPSPSTW